jgi:hypothetical protein
MAFNYRWKEVGCHDPAQSNGALVLIDNKCIWVWGKKVEITEEMNSIMEGFQITNYNFHTNASSPKPRSPSTIPGPVQGFYSGV